MERTHPDKTIPPTETQPYLPVRRGGVTDTQELPKAPGRAPEYAQDDVEHMFDAIRADSAEYMHDRGFLQEIADALRGLLQRSDVKVVSIRHIKDAQYAVGYETSRGSGEITVERKSEPKVGPGDESLL